MQTEVVVTTSQRYLALDALRGAAALAVVLHHLPIYPRGESNLEFAPVFASGYLAVDLFFTLSGFVIALAYKDRLLSSLTIRQFIIARFIRLQPVIAFGVSLGFAIAITQRILGQDGATGFWEIGTSLIPNLWMMPNILMPTASFLLNPPAWSVFYEIIANTAYALALKKHFKAPRQLRFMASTLTILISICGGSFLGLILAANIKNGLNHGIDLTDLPIALLRVTFSFTLGLLLHHTREKWHIAFLKISTIWLLFACLVFLTPDLNNTPRIFYDLCFVILISPLLVMLTAISSPPHHLKTFANQLGLISFPLYGLHAPIKHLVHAVFALSPTKLAALTLCLSLCAAWLTATKLEPVAHRWLRKHWQQNHGS